jgi:hypothetical protein
MKIVKDYCQITYDIASPIIEPADTKWHQGKKVDRELRL